MLVLSILAFLIAFGTFNANKDELTNAFITSAISASVKEAQGLQNSFDPKNIKNLITRDTVAGFVPATAIESELSENELTANFSEDARKEFAAAIQTRVVDEAYAGISNATESLDTGSPAANPMSSSALQASVKKHSSNRLRSGQLTIISRRSWQALRL